MVLAQTSLLRPEPLRAVAPGGMAGIVFLVVRTRRAARRVLGRHAMNWGSVNGRCSKTIDGFF
jgi:hypothetical protein